MVLFYFGLGNELASRRFFSPSPNFHLNHILLQAAAASHLAFSTLKPSDIKPFTTTPSSNIPPLPRPTPIRKPKPVFIPPPPSTNVSRRHRRVSHAAYAHQTPHSTSPYLNAPLTFPSLNITATPLPLSRHSPNTYHPHAKVHVPNLLFKPISTRKLIKQILRKSPPRIVLTGGAPSTPFRSIFEALSSTIHRDTVAAPLVEAVATPLRNSMAKFPWNVSTQHRTFLNESGINISEFGTKAHPHPTHKVIETNLLHDVWTHYATTPSSVLFMKPSKFNKMQQANPNITDLHNYRLTPKDTTRYPTTSPSLPSTETVFMHDALMYFTPGQILDLFQQAPTVQKLYASLVVPPESSFTDITLNPSLYKFHFQNDSLVYQLENNPVHSYTQPRSALDWLKTTTISDNSLTLSVSILDSWGPVHSLLIQRGLAPITSSHDTITFRTPSAILLPEANSIRQDIRHRLVPKDIYHNLFSYTRSVRTLRVTDPAGYIRTQASKPEFDWVTSAAWDNLQHFSLHTSPHRPVSHYMLFRSPFQRLKHWATTNEYHIFTLLALLATPIAFKLSSFLTTAPRLYIKQLTVFSHHLVGRPSLAHRYLPPIIRHFLTPTPRFSLHLGTRPAIHPDFNILKPLLHKIPWLISLLPKAPTPLAATLFIASMSAIPLAFWCHRRFFGPDHPQALHDQYQAYFHPKDWTLTLDRAPLTTSPQPFLPFEPIPTQPESLNIPSNATPASPAPTTQAQEHASTPLDTPSKPPNPPTSSPPTPPPCPTSDFVSSDRPHQSPLDQFPVPPTDPQGKPAPPSTNEHLFRHPLPKAPDALPENLFPDFFNQPAPPRSSSAPPASVNLRPQTPFVKPIQPQDCETGNIIPPPEVLIPLAKPDPPPASPLLADPTATSDVKLWSEHLPREYLSNCGSFLFRERSTPASDLPYPSTTDCLLQAVSKATGIDPHALWRTLTSHLPDSLLDTAEITQHGLNTDHFTVLASIYDLKCTFLTNHGPIEFGVANAPTSFTIRHTPPTSNAPGHFELVSDAQPPKLNGSRTADLQHIMKSFRSDNALLPFQKFHTYMSNTRRAKNLISNLKNGFDGIMATVNPQDPNSARHFFMALDHQMDIAAPRQVHLVHLAGFAGCGKSYPIQQLLQHQSFRSSRVAVPTTELRTEWKEGMHLKSTTAWRVSTWESSLLKRSRVLVIDEVYKMPRGYLDLSILADPTLELVILLGDPLQGEYHSTHPSSSNHKISSEIPHLKPYIDYYCLWSRRVPQVVAKFFNIPSLNPNLGSFSYTPHLPEGYPVLACSNNQVQTLTQCGFRSVSVASSQGSTYTKGVVLHLDRNSKLLSLAHSLVALTRSKDLIIFSGDKHQLLPGGNRLFTEFFSQRPVDLNHLFHNELSNIPLLHSPLTTRRPKLTGSSQIKANLAIHLTHHNLSSLLKPDTAPPSNVFHSNPGHVILPDPHNATAKSRYTSIDSNYTADIYLNQSNTYHTPTEDTNQISTHFLPETRRPLHFDLPSTQTSDPNPSSAFLPSSSAPEPVYPGENFESVASSFIPPTDPETREIRFHGELSNQFPYVNMPFKLSSLPSSTLAAIHSSKHDPTLLPASIPKRLRFRHNDSPYQISPKDELLGTFLYTSLLKAYRRPLYSTEPFDEALFIECINANEFSQLTSKTQNVIMANAYRSDPDWRWSAVRIFAKTQHKTNDASIFGNWKACQTLALMHDAVILLLGPVKKYQRIFDKRDRPSNIYIHASKTPFDLSHWCQQHLTHSIHIANDYTAFDQSQHGEAVVLEVKKMQRLNIPQHLIDLHIHLKTHVSTQFGPLTCMRLTGEPGTYDDNTDYNLAVLFSEYAITDEAVLVSGDDSLIDRVPPTRPTWPAIQQLLHLRFKKELSRYSLFCGYFVGPEGAVRCPIALFAKILQAIDDSTIPDKMASYLTEFSIGHSIGQPMWNLLPIHQVMYQSALFDFFCRAAPPSWKVALRIGEVEDSLLELLSSSLKWVSNPVFAISSPHEGELLPSFDSLTHSPDLLTQQTIHFPHHLSGASHPPHLPMEELLALLPALRELLSKNSSDAHPSSPQTVAPAILPGSSSGMRLVSPPRLPAPVRSLTTPASLAQDSISLPFQFTYYTITGVETGSTSLDVSGKDVILNLIKPFSHARLISLEAVVFPYSASLTYPQTFDAVWSTADSVIAGADIINVYGAQRVTFGGPVSSSVLITIPADLKTMNPILRDSVTYKDCPKLNLAFYTNHDNLALGTKTPNCGAVIIRGVIQGSSVRPTPTK
uniref:Polyprotein n=1 Tax=Davidia involucrata marafivirus 1 TaxID=2794433 RepID=A0A7T5QZA8_9VIRU|nr:polyprotein [Davidia involucrata marafivirus 1]